MHFPLLAGSDLFFAGDAGYLQYVSDNADAVP